MDLCLFPESLMSLLKTPRPPEVADVLKRLAFEADPTTLPGTIGREPHAIEQWAAKLPPGCLLGLYYLHGHEVSRGDGP